MTAQLCAASILVIIFIIIIRTKAFVRIVWFLEELRMNVGDVIRKYRKEAGMTQEEMADKLGVTTPAVNKWENKNSNPDIELLAPIARLLHISLDTLLSFQGELTPAEIKDIVREMDQMFDSQEYETVYAWALEKIREYPNCNMLIWQLAVILDARRLTDGVPDADKYDGQIIAWYETALSDEKEEVRRQAAESLFNLYLRKEQYAEAEKYLKYFLTNDPMKKIYQGRLYQAQGDKENAYTAFESVLFSTYQALNLTFTLMIETALEEGDFKKAHYLAEKLGAAAGLFEMGKYNECSPMLNVVCAEKNVEETYRVAVQLLESIDSLCDFRKSGLYRHMKFTELDRSFAMGYQEKIMELFKSKEDFGYMEGYKDWERLIGKG